MTVPPHSRNHFTTVDLPEAALPVTATFNIGNRGRGRREEGSVRRKRRSATRSNRRLRVVLFPLPSSLFSSNERHLRLVHSGNAMAMAAPCLIAFAAADHDGGRAVECRPAVDQPLVAAGG